MIEAITHGEHGTGYTYKETKEEKIQKLKTYLICLNNDKKHYSNKVKKIENHMQYVKKEIEELRNA